MSDIEKLQACYQFAAGRCPKKEDLKWAGKFEKLSNCSSVPASCELYNLPTQKAWREARKQYFASTNKVKALEVEVSSSEVKARTLLGQAQNLADRSAGEGGQALVKVAEEKGQEAGRAGTAAATTAQNLSVARGEQEQLYKALKAARRAADSKINDLIAINRMAQEAKKEAIEKEQAQIKQVERREEQQAQADIKLAKKERERRDARAQLDRDRARVAVEAAELETATVEANTAALQARGARGALATAQSAASEETALLDANKAVTEAADAEVSAAEAKVREVQAEIAAALP